MEKCTIWARPTDNGAVCHGGCPDGLKEAEQSNKLPAGAWCSFDRKSQTLSLTVPRGIMTIVSTRRRQRQVPRIAFRG